MLQRSATKSTTMTMENGGVITPSAASVTFDNLIGADLNVPGNCTSKEYLMTIPITGIQMFAIAVFKTTGDPGLSGELIIEFDSGPSPAPLSFTVTEDNGIAWVNGDPEDCPLTVAVTTVWITNKGSASMVVQIRAGVIATQCQG